jgi:nucleotide-binding universal stress UspA family protein
MSSILLPTDLSDASLNAAAFALDAFDGDQSEYVLLHTTHPPIIGPIDAPLINEHDATGDLRVFERRVRQLRPALALSISSIILNGALKDAIHRVCRDRRIDAVVMGTTWHAAPFTGNAIADVVQHAPKPVILVPPEWAPGAVNRILYADDREAIDRRSSLTMLTKLAARHDAEVVLTHIRTSAEAPLPVSELAGHANWFKGVRHTTADAIGDNAAQKILELSETGGFDMIAVLHRERGLLDALIHRSLAKSMSLHARVPLLVLHE